MAAQLNPYDDPGPWGFVTIGGLRVPGVIASIDGAEKPDQWEVQKATEKSNATTVWKGTNVAETIKIVTALPNRAAIASFYQLKAALCPKVGSKPPSLVIVHPSINFTGITRISYRNMPGPKWNESGGKWMGEISLIEYNPPKAANTGPANTVRIGVTTLENPAVTAAARDLQAAVDESQQS